MGKRFFIACIALALASCASSSKEKEAQDPFVTLDNADEFAPLAEGAKVYVSVDVKGARSILDLLSSVSNSGKDAAQILDRTDIITAALYPKGSGNAFLASAQGAYPKTLAEFSLSLAKDWEKKKNPKNDKASYWFSKSNKLAIAFNAKRALASDLDPFAPTQILTIPGTVSPKGFDDFRQNAVIAGWLNDADASLNAFIESAGIPFDIEAKSLFFKVTPLTGEQLKTVNLSGEQYETLVRIETLSGSIAAGLVSLFNVARLFTAGAYQTSDPLGILLKNLFANNVIQDGAFLNLKIGPMDAEKTALLFNIFSLYSKQ
jgi:hypothetical protein